MSDQQIILALAAAGGLLLLTLLLVIGYLLGSRSRRHQPAPIDKGQLTPIDLSALAALPGVDALAPAFNTLSAQLGEVREKVQLLQTSAAVEEERRRQEASVWETIRNVDRTLSTFQTEERQRWGPEDSAFTSLQRLTAVMLGSARVGATGERLVQDALRGLPPQWLLSNHRVAGKPVEFAVKLPDGHILPIDSKVAAQDELDRLGRPPTPTSASGSKDDPERRPLARLRGPSIHRQSRPRLRRRRHLRRRVCRRRSCPLARLHREPRARRAVQPRAAVRPARLRAAPPEPPAAR